jgi:MoaA/NifB/PqqE/SkfB family radical SAM enzyme
MCDIWKGNQNLKQLTEKDVEDLMVSLKKLRTQQVVMSGGEALLHNRFFSLCEIIRRAGINITLLSTGLSLKKNAEQIISYVDEVIVSLDGDATTHNTIRNIPNAFEKLKEGINAIRLINPTFRISGRTVIHKMNFRKWPNIIDAARELALDQISFLPADVNSHAFNREVLWSDIRQHEVLLMRDELPELKNILEKILAGYEFDINTGFIAESSAKLQNIYQYYAAVYGLNPYPFKKCNAPWVSAVIEADGTVKPCFFHNAIGSIHDESLINILNSEKGLRFRKNLDIENNDTCRRCVCYLNLPPGMNLKSWHRL